MAQLQDMYDAWIAEEKATVERLVASGQYTMRPDLGEMVVSQEITHHSGKTSNAKSYYTISVLPDHTVRNPAEWSDKEVVYEASRQLREFARSAKQVEYIHLVDALGKNDCGHHYAIWHPDNVMAIYDLEACHSELYCNFRWMPPTEQV